MKKDKIMESSSLKAIIVPALLAALGGLATMAYQEYSKHQTDLVTQARDAHDAILADKRQKKFDHEFAIAENEDKQDRLNFDKDWAADKARMTGMKLSEEKSAKFDSTQAEIDTESADLRRKTLKD
jgi:hypothetical protein